MDMSRQGFEYATGGVSIRKSLVAGAFNAWTNVRTASALT